MPWIDKDDCVGCGLCVEECPVETISMMDGKAEIDMHNCIRCGTCHEVCPESAVKHDSEKIPDEVDANVAKTKEFMNACAKHLGNDKEKQKCLARIQQNRSLWAAILRTCQAENFDSLSNFSPLTI